MEYNMYESSMTAGEEMPSISSFYLDTATLCGPYGSPYQQTNMAQFSDFAQSGMVASDLDDTTTYPYTAMSPIKTEDYDLVQNDFKQRQIKAILPGPPLDMPPFKAELDMSPVIDLARISPPFGAVGPDMLYFGPEGEAPASFPGDMTSLQLYPELNQPLMTMTPPESPIDAFSPHSNSTEEFDEQHMSSPETKYFHPEMEAVEVSEPESPMSPHHSTMDSDTARNHALYKDAMPSVDGLYHCPWETHSECNHKPEKLKCNYDKYVDSHLRPYRCKMPACEATRFSSTACLLRHEREAHRMHGHRALHCRYEGCERSVEGKGFPRAWNLRDHMRRVHNDHSYPSDIVQESTKTKGRRIGKEQNNNRRRSKAALAAAAAIAAAAAAAEAEARMKDDEWQSNVSELRDIIQSLGQRRDSKNPEQIKVAQKKMEKMASMLQLSIPSSIKPATAARRASQLNSNE